MREDPPMDDALLDGWDAYLRGDRFDDRLSKDDLEVLTMLHTRTWTPSAPARFKASLRSRLTVPGHLRAESPASRRRSVTDVMSSQLTFGPGSASRHGWQRALLAVALVLAMLASVRDRLVDEPTPSPVQAPSIMEVTASPVAATPHAADGRCDPLATFALFVTSVFVDVRHYPKIVPSLASARYASIQQLDVATIGSALPPSYYTSGVTGVVIDTIVTGSATARLSSGGWVSFVTDVQAKDGRPLAPLETAVLVRGDSLIYPVGALIDLTNILENRNLQIARVVLHDTSDLLAGEISDTVTLRNLGELPLSNDHAWTITDGFVLALLYEGGLTDDVLPTVRCSFEGSDLAVDGLIADNREDGTSYSGYLGWISPRSE